MVKPQGGTALESSEKKWVSSFLDRLATGSSDNRIIWQDDIVRQWSVNFWWRPQRRSALLVPERTNSGMKPRNPAWGGGVRCQ
jgi:hypothetical protein